MAYQSSVSKRRRLNDGRTISATGTLSKPFKSPLKQVPEKANRGLASLDSSGRLKAVAGTLSTNELYNGSQPTQQLSSSPEKQDRAENAEARDTNEARSCEEPLSTPSPSPTKTTKLPARSTRVNRPFTSPRKKDGSGISTSKSAGIAAASMSVSAKAEIAALNSDIDTLNQALRIISTKRPAELEALIGIWKRAAREAAEEVYAVAKDRVNRIGGVGAWREVERERRLRRAEWELQAREAEQEQRERELRRNIARSVKTTRAAEKRQDRLVFGDIAPRADVDDRTENPAGEWESEEDEAEVEGECEEVARLLIDRATEGNASQEDDKDDHASYSGCLPTPGAGAEGEGRDDDEFTMDMILSALNVDIAVLGFDREEQRWVE